MTDDKTLKTVIRLNEDVIERKSKEYRKTLARLVKLESEIVAANRDKKTAESELQKKPWYKNW